jgi:hypothetical protein
VQRGDRWLLTDEADLDAPPDHAAPPPHSH